MTTRYPNLLGDLCLAKRRKNLWLGFSVSTQAELDDAMQHVDVAKSRGRVVVMLMPIREAISIGKCLDMIDWLIVGGEIKSNHEPMACELRWLLNLIASAQGKVPVFVNNLGSRFTVDGREWSVSPYGRSSDGGNPEYWPGFLNVREYPSC